MTDSVNEFVHQHSVTELPAFPAVVLSLLELMSGGDAGPRDVEAIIRRDSTLTTRLLGAANAAALTRGTPAGNLREAISRLGLTRVHTLAVTAAVRGYFRALDQGQPTWQTNLWNHGLLCAVLSRELARVRGACPEAAYLAGLLHDLGKPVLALAYPDAYGRLLQKAECSDVSLHGLEHRQWGLEHSGVGAELLAYWGFPALITDAVRYHHQPVADLAHAHPLVRCVALANLLSRYPEMDVTGRQAAARLLDLGRADAQALLDVAYRELAETRAAFGEDADADPAEANEQTLRALGKQARTAALAGGLGATLAEGETIDNIIMCVALLFGVRHLLVLQVDEDQEQLRGTATPTAHPGIADLSLPLDAEASPIASCLLHNRIDTLEATRQGSTLPVADCQVLDRLDGETALTLPLFSSGRPVGLLVLGLRREQTAALQQETGLLRAFADQAGALLARQQQEARALRASRESARAEQQERQLRLVTEAANPITVMQNYLGVLQQQLEQDHPGQGGLSALRDEVERIKELISSLEAESTGEAPCDRGSGL